MNLKNRSKHWLGVIKFRIIPVYWGYYNSVRFPIQRARRGYSDGDWWDFDLYLAGIIASAARKFRLDSLSYPAHMTREQWTQILLLIEEGFLSYIKAHETLTNPTDDYKFQRAKALLMDNYESLWD